MKMLVLKLGSKKSLIKLVSSSLPCDAAPAPEKSSGKTCVCGGTDHLRRSSAWCPLNKTAST